MKYIPILASYLMALLLPTMAFANVAQNLRLFNAYYEDLPNLLKQQMGKEEHRTRFMNLINY